MAVKVSIVVRSCNDIDYIRQTLDMIQKQSFQDFELVNPDSNSSDGTFDIIKQYNPNVYRIEGKYVPGLVLNDAVARCNGEIIVFNNSDCVPQDEFWLENIIKPFQDDQVVAVYGKQLPREDAFPLVIKDYERAFSEQALNWTHFFSLATSAIRKKSLIDYPFDEKIQYSEDIEWSWRARKRGEKIVFASDSVVEHSHNYTNQEIKKRFYGEGLAEPAIYGKRCFEETYLGCVLKPVLAETLRDWLYLLKKKNFDWLFKAPYYRYLQRANVYRGIKDYYKNLMD